MRLNNVMHHARVHLYAPAERGGAQPLQAAAPQPQQDMRVPDHIAYRVSPQSLLASRVYGELQGVSAPREITGASALNEPRSHICVTCQERRFVDDSADGAVSFQMPTNLPPVVAGDLIIAHEREHIANERVYAERGGRTVVSESVRIHTAICPDCGMIYVAGGEARTTTVPDEPLPQHPVLDLLESLQ